MRKLQKLLLPAMVLAGALVVRGQSGITIEIVNIIPQALSAETNQDSEPFLAVDLSKPERMAASAFTPNPAGPDAVTAPLFITEDDGKAWRLNNIIPTAGLTADLTSSFGPAGELHAGILERPSFRVVAQLVTKNFAAADPMTLLNRRESGDQPFIYIDPSTTPYKLFVAFNDNHAQDGKTASVDVSLDGGKTFQTTRLESRTTSNQNGPSIRVHGVPGGKTYAAYFGWRSFDGRFATSDIVITREDGNDGAFDELRGSDGKRGKIIASDRLIPWSGNSAGLGQERIGSTLSLAVDPKNDNKVYIVWADQVDNHTYTIHVRRTEDGGATWSDDLRELHEATGASIAINANGTIALLYQKLEEAPGGQAGWLTIVELTSDGFTTAPKQFVLSATDAFIPARQYYPYLGDYFHLIAIRNEFRGVFSASNVPDPVNFPQGLPRYQRLHDFDRKVLLDALGGTVPTSVDPFFFRIRM